MPAESSYVQGQQRPAPDFQALVDAYYVPLYRFAMSLTQSEADAHDLVQDAFLLWANKGHQLQDASKAKSWLFTSTYRAFLQKHRRASRFPHVEISNVSLELPQIEPIQSRQLEARDVLKLLAELEPEYRSAVSLFYLEDYSYNEIATILNVPLGTVKSRLARGLAQLRALVSETARRAAPEEEL